MANDDHGHDPRHMAEHFWLVESTESIWIQFTDGSFYSYDGSGGLANFFFTNISNSIDDGLNVGQILAQNWPTLGLGAYTKQTGPPAVFDFECDGYGNDDIPGEQGTVY